MMIWTGSAELGGQDTVTVTAPHKQALLADIERRMLAGQGFSIATLNLDHVVKLQSSGAFLEAYLQQTHVTADGNPIVWLSRLSGHDVSLTPGSELIEPVAAIAQLHDLPIALVGSTTEALAGAAAALETRYPGLRIVARISPPMGFDPDGAGADALIDELGQSGARLCFLALGAPKQEILAARAFARLPQVGFLSIGAGLDFLSGHQTRAPRLVRRFAAEWLWRLLGNPRRLGGRYAASIAILPRLTLRAVKTRLGSA